MQTLKAGAATLRGFTPALQVARFLPITGRTASFDSPFAKLTSGPWREAATSISATSCDYANDGWPDVFVGRLDSLSTLYHNQHGTFTMVNTVPIPTPLPSARGAAWADYDNEGWPDLVAGCLVDAPQKASVVFHGPARGLFEPLTNRPWATATGRAVAVSWADFNGEGRRDLLIGRGALALNVSDGRQ